MPLPKHFPRSPYEILDPSARWTPEAGGTKKYENLFPPLVRELRKKVKTWRDNKYAGASETSRALLHWWFDRRHESESDEFRYYFAQREAVETVIYLQDAAKARDKNNLFQYDSSGTLTEKFFPETWLRLLIKMATGSGKTKVISLLMAWSYFHKKYEENSSLARNFLLVAPNIIVLDRLRADFAGGKIFTTDPILPDNGYEGQNWRDDFQILVRVQEEISAVRKTGNLFLTNIQRIYPGKDHIPGADDDDTKNYYLGDKSVAKTGDSKINLADVVRDVDELIVFNDEAHHIHNEKLAWFKSIEEIHGRMRSKGGGGLSLQIDVTATPKHNNGRIFAQTVSDYPLVEAIYQNVVKHPVLPDKESRAKLREHKNIKYEEQYRDYINLGYAEWKKVYDEHMKLGKKSVLFVMTDNTKNCDDVAAYLKKLPALGGKDAILTIHTKNNGEISESSTGKQEKELLKLRKAANEIDNADNPYKAIVSVLMLKEGWDVKNVTTIVGLRAYSAKSNILPEQTLGRGLRRMFQRFTASEEKVSVIGTDAFMKFVESIQEDGVQLEYEPMGDDTKPQTGMLIEVDNENPKKNIAELDMQIPILTPRMWRDFKKMSKLDVSALDYKKLPIRQFTEEERRKIIFYRIVGGEISHYTELEGGDAPTYREVLAHYAREIMQEIRLFSDYDILFGKLKEFAAEHLFVEKVDLEDVNIVRNLSEPQAAKTIIETFVKAINMLMTMDKGAPQIRGQIHLSDMLPFFIPKRRYLPPQKSPFNKIIGDNNFELEFAGFLDACPDVVSFAKNYYAVKFRMEYVAADGHIRNYHPDFLVKISETEAYIVETKGREDINDAPKIRRLRQWCEDVNKMNAVKFSVLYVKQDIFEKYRPKNFAEAIAVFQQENPHKPS